MHHLKETTIDGVKFVLIPEELHDKLAKLIAHTSDYEMGHEAAQIADTWQQYDPEVFHGL